LFSIVMTGALVGLMLLFNRHSLGIFLPDDGAANGIAQHINAIVSWTFILFGVTIVLFGTVRATGAVMPPLVILLISVWGVRLPFAWLLEPHFGPDAIWWSFAVGSCVSLVLAVAYYRFGGWRRARLLPVAGRGDGVPVGQVADTGVAVPTATVVERS
jgi:Na+-driven multidrug efflux pump